MEILLYPQWSNDCYSAVPDLTLENVIKCLKDLSEIWYIIGFNLNMPPSKLDDIEDAVDSDEVGLTLMVKEWLQSGGRKRKWRDILWAICRIIENLTDEDMESEEDMATMEDMQSVCIQVMPYAEPIDGRLITWLV